MSSLSPSQALTQIQAHIHSLGEQNKSIWPIFTTFRKENRLAEIGQLINTLSHTTLTNQEAEQIQQGLTSLQKMLAALSTCYQIQAGDRGSIRFRICRIFLSIFSSTSIYSPKALYTSHLNASIDKLYQKVQEQIEHQEKIVYIIPQLSIIEAKHTLRNRLGPLCELIHIDESEHNNAPPMLTLTFRKSNCTNLRQQLLIIKEWSTEYNVPPLAFSFEGEVLQRNGRSHHRVFLSSVEFEVLTEILQLQSLQFHRSNIFTDANLIYLRRCLSLTSLEFSLCYDITDISLPYLQDCPCLTSLSMIGCNKLTDNGISSLGSISTLTSLELSLSPSTGSITDQGIASLSQLKKLTLLHLYLGGTSTITTLSFLEPLTELTSLSLQFYGNRITDLSPLQNMRNLTFLKLWKLRGISDISPIQNMSKLRSLDLFGLPLLTDLSPLQHLQQLTSLSLWELVGLTNLSPLKYLKQLRSLQLLYCPKISNVSSLKHLHNITSLNFTHCHCIVDSLSALQHLTKLTSLTLQGAAIKNMELNHLRSLKNLVELNIVMSPNIGDKGLHHLRFLTSLKQLAISYCLRITPKGLRSLLPLQKLVKLDLSFCNIKNEGFRYIKSLRQLRHLTLAQCPITQQYRKEMSRRLPKLQIEG